MMFQPLERARMDKIEAIRVKHPALSPDMLEIALAMQDDQEQLLKLLYSLESSVLNLQMHFLSQIGRQRPPKADRRAAARKTKKR